MKRLIFTLLTITLGCVTLLSMAQTNPILNLTRTVTIGANTFNPDITGGTAQVGNVYTQVYTLRNNTSGSSFTGSVRFSEVIPAGLRINSLNYRIGTGAIVTSIPTPQATGADANTITIPISGMGFNQTITITEIIEVMGCLENGNGVSTSLLVFCDANNNCPTANNLNVTTNINRNNNNPSLTVNASGLQRDLICYGINGTVTRSMVITNTGSAVANNVIFNLRNSPNNPYLIVDGSIRVTTPAGTFTPFFAIIRDHNNFFDEAGYGAPFTDVDLLRGIINTRGLTSNSSDMFIYGAEISNIGQGNPINIPPGQSITISWQETSTCFRDDVTGLRGVMDISNNIDPDITYNDECGVQLSIPDIAGDVELFDAAQRLNVYEPIMEGDPDRCFQTRDGAIQTFTIENNRFTLSENYLTANNAELVYQLLLSPGLELDLSLRNQNPASPAMDLTYNHQACRSCNETFGTPFPTCTTGLNVMPATSYDVTFLSLGTIINLPNRQIVPIAATPLINVTGEDPLNARIVYEIRLPITDLRQAWLDNPGTFATLNAFIANLTIQYRLRSYCEAPTSLFRENLIFRYNCAVNTCTPDFAPSATEVTLFSVGGRVDVLCPGCITPGATIIYTPVNGVPATHFLRTDASVGFPDNNNDGIPEGTGLANNADRRLATDGDVMEGVVRIGYSDGNDFVPNGFTKATLTANGIRVDNLYLDVAIPNGLTVNLNNVNVRIFDGTGFTHNYTLAPTAITTRPGHVVFRVAPTTPANYNFNTLGPNAFVEIRANYTVGHLGNEIDNYDLRYEAMFSDCDNCTGGMTSFAGGAADICNGTMGNTCVDTRVRTNPNLFYLCEGGAGMFGYVPFFARFDYGGANGNCDKTIGLSYEEGVYNMPNIFAPNGFPNEYRTFLGTAANPQVTFTAQIPPGYRIAAVTIGNFDQTGLNHTVSENLTVAPTVNLNAAPYLNGQQFSISLNYARKNSTQWTPPNPNFNPATDFLTMGDENVDTRMNIHLVQNVCSPLTNYSIRPETYIRSTTLPVPLPDNPNTVRINGHGGLVTFFTPPRTNLMGIPLGPQAINIANGTFIIPIRMDNTAPGIIDPNNNNPLPSIDAINTFLRVNLPANSGLTVTGALSNFNLTTNTGTPVPIVDGIIQLGTIPANTVNNPNHYYGVVVQYTCGSSCNPLITCAANPLTPIAGCLANTPLTVNYGWNCNNYPTNATNLSEMCENETVNYTLNTVGAALNVLTSINGSSNSLEYIDNCLPVNYQVTVNSCHPGGLNNFNVTVSYPSSFTNFTLTNSTALANTGIVVTQGSTTLSGVMRSTSYVIVANGTTGLANGQFIMDFSVNVPCAFQGGSISAVVNSRTYCGTTSPFKTVTTSLAPTSIPLSEYDNVTLSSINCTANQVAVHFNRSGTPRFLNQIRISLPIGFRQALTNATGVIVVNANTASSPYILNFERIPNGSVACTGSATLSVSMERGFVRACSPTNTCTGNPVYSTPLTCNINLSLPAISLNAIASTTQCNCYSIYATTGVPGMALELWNGSTWVYNQTTNANGYAMFDVCITASTTFTVRHKNTTCNSSNVTVNPFGPNMCASLKLTECSDVLFNSMNDLIKLHNAYPNTGTVALNYNSALAGQCNGGNPYYDTQYGLVKLNGIYRFNLGWPGYSGNYNDSYYKIMPLSTQCNFLLANADRDNLQAPVAADFVNGVFPTYLSANEKVFAVNLQDVAWSPYLFRMDWSKTGSGFNYMGTCPPDSKFMISDVTSISANEIYNLHFFLPKPGETYEVAYNDYTKRNFINKNDIQHIISFKFDPQLCSSPVPQDYSLWAKGITALLQMKNGSQQTVYLGMGGHDPWGSWISNTGYPHFQFKEENCAITCNIQTSIYQAGCNLYKAGVATSMTGNLTYQWSKDGTPIAGATSVSLLAATAGNYSVTVTHTSPNGLVCTSTSSMYTTPTQVNVPTITATNTVICSGGNSLLATNATGVSYQWYRNGTPVAGETNGTLLTTVPGTYSLNASSNGCSAVSSQISLTSSSNSAHRVTTNPDFTRCASSPATLLKAGQSISFNGTNDHISFPATGFTLPAANAITVEFWTYIHGPDVGSATCAFSIGNLDQPNRCMAMVPWYDRKLYWDYGNGIEGQGRISTDFTNYLNKQTHVALVANGGTRRIYLDGIEVQSFTNGTDPGPDVTLNGMTIGKFLSNYHRGHLDQFRVWDTERTLAQIKEGMFEEYPGGTSNLLGSWRFDEYSGSIILNDVNGYNGTLNGTYGVRGHLAPTYKWTPYPGLSVTTGPTLSAAPNVTTRYYLTGTVSNGCSYTASVNAIVNPCREASLNEDSVLEDNKVHVFPNPFVKEIHILIEGNDKKQFKVQIYDLNGRMMLEKEIAGNVPQELGTDLHLGVYLLKVNFENGNSNIRRIVKIE